VIFLSYTDPTGEKTVPKQILIIEDNADIIHLLSVNLRSMQMKVEHASDGKSGLELALSGRFDLIILDLMLPEIDGLDVCRRLREKRVFTPVLMLTARTSELDRVLGLEVGADDYLTKPFSVPELIARVNAILRRAEHYHETDTSTVAGSIQFDDLLINPETRQVSISDKQIDLTAREFDLLWHFATHPGRVFTRTQLLDMVWGYGHDGYEHTVNSHINRLRAKIETDPAKPHFVLTVWGVGYKFAKTAAELVT
jgi:DNA-binding response OmpR family regulator